MAHKIVLQPNGNFSVFSTVVDSFIHINLSYTELVHALVAGYVSTIIKEVTNSINKARDSSKPIDFYINQIKEDNYSDNMTNKS